MLMDRATVILSALFLLSPLAEASLSPRSSFQQESVMKIRVRLTPGEKNIKIRGTDLRIQKVSYESSPHQSALSSKTAFQSEWQIDCDSNRVFGKTTDLKPSQFNLSEGVRVWSPAGFLTYQGRPYREEVVIYPAAQGCEVINIVDIETYLDGIVNTEFNSKWSPEAVAAQVIAARTYALYQMKMAQARKARYDVDSTIKDQLYEGSDEEDHRAARVVDRTKGLVLVAAHNQKQPLPIKAFYHSTCGGRTELPQTVWGKAYEGFKRRVACPFCRPSPSFEWEIMLSPPELEKAVRLGALLEKAQPSWPKDWRNWFKYGHLEDLRIKHKLLTKRNSTIEIQLSRIGDRGEREHKVFDVSSLSFRKWIGTQKLKSTSFDLYRRHDQGHVGSYIFKGRGYGHGVGLCQWGAKVMGEKGFSFNNILRHYYPDAQIKKLY